LFPKNKKSKTPGVSPGKGKIVFKKREKKGPQGVFCSPCLFEKTTPGWGGQQTPPPQTPMNHPGGGFFGPKKKRGNPPIFGGGGCLKKKLGKPYGTGGGGLVLGF